MDRATGSVNTWVDNKAPVIVGFVRENMSFLPHSEIGYMTWLFFLTIIGVLVLAYWDTRKSSQEAGSPILPTKNTSLIGVPPPLSASDVVNIEKFKVVFRAHASPACNNIREIERKLREKWTHGKGPKDLALKDESFFILTHNGVLVPFSNAQSRMMKVLEGSDKNNLQVLQEHFVELFLTYQNFVRWTYRLGELFPPAIDKYLEYEEWQRKHRVFHEKLRELIALDDFSYLKNRISGNWQDKF